MTDGWTALPATDVDATRALFGYLYLRDALAGGDVIVGFGHFDPKIPRRCGELYCAGWAERLLFTGGVGAGTADLGQPEAVFARAELLRLFPEIPVGAIAVERASTNTAENIRLSAAVVQAAWPSCSFESGMHRALLVATAYRQRRVALTWQKLLPHIEGLNAPPETTFEAEQAMFAGKGQDLAALMAGEVQRLVRYSELGWIAPAAVPAEIVAWAERLGSRST